MRSLQKIMIIAAFGLFATSAYAEPAKTKATESHAKGLHEDWSKMPADMKDAERGAFKAKWEAMSPDEKKAFHEERHKKRMERRAEMKEKWENATPEEREKMKAERKARKEERREKMKEKWENATPEEREKMKTHREQRKERREKMKEVHKEGHDKH